MIRSASRKRECFFFPGCVCVSYLLAKRSGHWGHEYGLSPVSMDVKINPNRFSESNHKVGKLLMREDRLT